MLRFLPGIILVQLMTVALVLLLPDITQDYNWAKIAVVLIVLAILMSLWFRSIALHLSKDEVMRLKEDFAREREDLRVKAERAKHRVLREAHKEINKETRRAHTRANARVTAAVAGVAGVGSLLLFTQFMTIGLLALSGAGGAAVGYFTRLRQESRKAELPQAEQAKVIAAKPAKSALPGKKTKG